MIAVERLVGAPMIVKTSSESMWHHIRYQYLASLIHGNDGRPTSWEMIVSLFQGMVISLVKMVLEIL